MPRVLPNPLVRPAKRERNLAYSQRPNAHNRAGRFQWRGEGEVQVVFLGEAASTRLGRRVENGGRPVLFSLSLTHRVIIRDTGSRSARVPAQTPLREDAHVCHGPGTDPATPGSP